MPIAPEKAMLFALLGVMGEAVPDHQSATIDPEAHSVPGQDQRLMGLPGWRAVAALLGAAA